MLTVVLVLWVLAGLGANVRLYTYFKHDDLDPWLWVLCFTGGLCGGPFALVIWCLLAWRNPYR